MHACIVSAAAAPMSATTRRVSWRGPGNRPHAMSAPSSSSRQAMISTMVSAVFASSPNAAGLLACRYQGAATK